MNEYSKKNPKLDQNMLLYAGFAYQLLYFKLGNKRLALNEHREKNLYPSGFFKFDITRKQKEYLDIISLGQNNANVFNLSVNLRNELKKLNIQLTFLDNLLELFNFIKEKTQKLGKLTKEAMNTFINDEKLFLIYYDFILRYSTQIDIK